MDNRVRFVQWILGDSEGYLAAGALGSEDGVFEESIFSWPNDILGFQKWIRDRNITHNLYFCPTLLNQPRRVKKSITRSNVLWADLDECSPELLQVKPTILIQTSPGRWQAFWKLKDPCHADDAERINKRIAYAHADDGCDKSGWDLTQYLRIPGTANHKYMPDMYTVKVIEFEAERKYDLTDFNAYPELKFEENIAEEKPMPDFSQDGRTGEQIIDSFRTSIHPKAHEIFAVTQGTDWSSALWSLMLMLFNAGAEIEEVFIVCRDSAVNKYKRDGKSEKLLWRDVLRAYEHSQNATLALSAHNDEADDWYIEDEPLLTDDERAVAEATTTIVDDYLEWGKSVGDAAPAYHIASAFVVLSALCSSSVRLPTSYGVVVPNVWFMILADTTLTRKSTAMDMGMDMLVEIDSGMLAATDGTVEGLMRTVSARSRQASIFLRDEFTGLLEAMGKKDYMAGMLEMLTKLYDGKYQKKELAKGTIEMRDPILIMFVGGIKQRVYELLTYQHINSGFLPRFCIITAESDPDRVKPLGPPTQRTTDTRDELLHRFSMIYNFYNPPVQPGQLMAPTFDAVLTPDAWVLYNRLEATMNRIGVSSAMDDIMTPMLARLCTSGLKVAVLIAAARCESELVVRAADLMKAFFYVETWKSHAIAVVANAGKTAQEKQLEQIYRVIRDSENGVMRSRIMQLYRLDARTANNVFETLLQRGLVKVEVTPNKGTRYHPSNRTIKKQKVKD